jgi:hypothetical protein
VESAYETKTGERDVSSSFVGLEKPTNAGLVSNLGGFLEAHGLAKKLRYHHALRFGRKLLRLEPLIDLDLCGLLVFCQFELWHVNDENLVALVQRLVSDKTLMDFTGRNKGWFLKVMDDYDGTTTPCLLNKHNFANVSIIEEVLSCNSTLGLPLQQLCQNADQSYAYHGDHVQTKSLDSELLSLLCWRDGARLDSASPQEVSGIASPKPDRPHNSTARLQVVNKDTGLSWGSPFSPLHMRFDHSLLCSR